MTAGPAGAGGIEIVDLVREYRRTGGRTIRAVDRVSLSIAPGEMFGLLGPNGAGKTTTIKILNTTLLPTSGTASVAGYDVVHQTGQVRRRIGFVLGGERGLYDRLDARDNLRYFADLYGVDGRTQRRRIPELLDQVGLLDRARDRVETFSRGMKQRLHIARGLIHDPPVVLLDEPTIGLDPVAARDLRVLLRRLADDGRTVLLTTHHMHEADDLCGRIAVISGGRTIAEGTATDIKRAAAGRQITSIEVYGADPGMLDRLRALSPVLSMEVETRELAHVVHLHTPMGTDVTAVALAQLHGASVGRVQTREPSLEDAYVVLVAGQAT